MYKKHLKNSIDFIGSLIGLIFLSPILVIVTLLLTITNNGKPLFFQERPGKEKNIFKMIKFKTMNDRKGKVSLASSSLSSLGLESLVPSVSAPVAVGGEG